MTKSIYYNDEDYRIVSERAKRAGMTVTGYIKAMSLEEGVVDIDLSPVLLHTQYLSALVARAAAITRVHTEDRLLYEADLERIEDLLAAAVRTELTLLDQMRNLEV